MEGSKQNRSPSVGGRRVRRPKDLVRRVTLCVCVCTFTWVPLCQWMCLCTEKDGLGPCTCTCLHDRSVWRGTPFLSYGPVGSPNHLYVLWCTVKGPDLEDRDRDLPFLLLHKRTPNSLQDFPNNPQLPKSTFLLESCTKPHPSLPTGS